MKARTSASPRRRFLKWASVTSLGALGVPIHLAAGNQTVNREELPKDLVILFQGDSITDGGRNRAHYYANDSQGMGNGYVYQIVAQILSHHPEDNIRCYNRGISGNKVYQLAARWQDDCLQLNPQVLSLLIGVNDFWHTLSNDYQGTPQIFNEDLRALLTLTKSRFPEIKILLGEPFAVKGGSALSAAWQRDFPPYQQVVKEVAADFQATFIPFQQVFDKALERAPVSYWCPDGVHPSMAGSALMKDAWINAFHRLW